MRERRGRRSTAYWAAVFLGSVSAPAMPVSLDSSLEITPYATVDEGVTALVWAPDGSGRLFVAKKPGIIEIVQNGTPLPAPFLTLAGVYHEIDSIPYSTEAGLLGFAFDPSFSTNGNVYLMYSVSETEQTIVRCTAIGNTCSTPVTVLGGLPGATVSHNGGALEFGPRGKLYFSIGDLLSPVPVGSDLSTLAGKIGRVNPDGSVPRDNPFVDGAGPNADHAWALGFRSPFKMTFHPVSGALWVNSVGAYYEQIFELSRGANAGWEAYENNQPSGYRAPLFAYRTNGSDVRDIVTGGAVRRTGVSTFTTDFAHKYRTGQKVTISGVTATSVFDGTAYVASTPTPTTFEIVQAGPDDEGGGGMVASVPLGGCVTGGAFFDSSAAPPDYRGDYFFLDYNVGTLNRIDLDHGGRVRTVDPVVEGMRGPVDVALGPDGALYAVTYWGDVSRIAHVGGSARLVVTPSNLRVAENGSGGFDVRLSSTPSTDVNVTVRRGFGDADIATDVENVVLTFTPSDWNAPQRVGVSATADEDAVEDVAILDVAADGYGTETVTVRATDADSRLVLTDVAALTMTEGGSGSIEVTLSSEPPNATIVKIASSNNDIVPRTDVLAFDSSNWDVPQAVEIDALPDADALDDLTELRLEAPGWASRTVSITAIDVDAAAPLFVSSAPKTAVVNAPYRYLVQALGRPAPVVELTTPIAGMTYDAATATLSWVPAATGVFDVGLRADNGVPPAAVETFSITVKDDEPPECVLTKPEPGETIFGSSEFFGDVHDDVGAVGATFSVDGVVHWDDVHELGHYHYGGTHNAFDTTIFANGPHALRMTGTDTIGQTCFVEVVVSVDNRATGDGGVGDGGVGVSEGGALDASADSGPWGRDGATHADTDASVLVDASDPIDGDPGRNAPGAHAADSETRMPPQDQEPDAGSASSQATAHSSGNGCACDIGAGAPSGGGAAFIGALLALMVRTPRRARGPRGRRRPSAAPPRALGEPARRPRMGP